MKKTKAVFALAAASLLLCGCSGNGSSTPASSVSSVSSSASSEASEMFTTSLPEDKVIARGITVGDYLIDFDVDCYMLTDHDYRISFSFSDGSPNDNPIVTSSRTDIATIFQDDNGAYFVHGESAGDFVLEIQDNTGYTHYRRVVHCRDAMSVEEIEDYLVEVDHFQSWLYEGNDQQLYFFDGGNAILKGKDEGTDIGSISFTFVHEEYNYNGTVYTDHDEEYFFRIPDFQNQTTTLALVGFYVSKGGDMIHTMTPSITAAVFNPVF